MLNTEPQSAATMLRTIFAVCHASDLCYCLYRWNGLTGQPSISMLAAKTKPSQITWHDTRQIFAQIDYNFLSRLDLVPMVQDSSTDCLYVLQEHEKEGDIPAEEDLVTAFLEEEMRKDPPRLDLEGFQGLVRRFCELAGLDTEQASPYTLCTLMTMQPCRGGWSWNA